MMPGLELADLLWLNHAFLLSEMAAEDGRIILASPALELMFRVPVSGGLVGRCVDCLVPEALQKAHKSHRQRFEASPQPQANAVTTRTGATMAGLRQDGTTFPVLVSLKGVRYAGRTCVLASVVDRSAVGDPPPAVATCKRS